MARGSRRRTRCSPATPKTRTACRRCSPAWTAAAAASPGGPSQPTVIMDRGLASDENLNLLRARGQHYIVASQQSERHELFPEVDACQVRAGESGREGQDRGLRPVAVTSGRTVCAVPQRRAGGQGWRDTAAVRATVRTGCQQAHGTGGGWSVEAAGEDQPGHRAPAGALSARGALLHSANAHR